MNFKIAYISDEQLGLIITGRIKVINLPADAQIVRIDRCIERNRQALMIESKAFKPTRAGEAFPTYHLQAVQNA